MLAHLRAMRRWPMATRLAVTVVGLTLAFLFQIPLETDVPGEPFLLFFLVVIAATLAFGQGAGLAGVALSTLFSFLFFEPGSSLALHRASDLVSIEVYALLACGAVIGIDRLVKALLAADEAAQAFQESERAKSVMLRELAHRVANNFAAVASLIRRKANLMEDSEARSVLNEAVEQVMVLARVHSRLNAGQGDMTLDAKDFLQELCDDLRVLIAPGQAVSLKCGAAVCNLSVSQAIPVGLIVNELVTNALKYAFPDGRAGTICVSLQEVGGHWSLAVHDDGIGFGSGRVRGTGLGLDLVRALAQQLGGELEVRSTDTGSKVCVAFPTAAAERAVMPVRPGASLLH